MVWCHCCVKVSTTRLFGRYSTVVAWRWYSYSDSMGWFCYCSTTCPFRGCTTLTLILLLLRWIHSALHWFVLLNCSVHYHFTNLIFYWPFPRLVTIRCSWAHCSIVYDRCCGKHFVMLTTRAIIPIRCSWWFRPDDYLDASADLMIVLTVLLGIPHLLDWCCFPPSCHSRILRRWPILMLRGNKPTDIQ